MKVSTTKTSIQYFSVISWTLGWALHWTRKVFGVLADHLQAGEEVGDQLDPIFVDALEGEVALHRPLVTCSLRPERDHGDLVCWVATMGTSQRSE